MIRDQGHTRTWRAGLSQHIIARSGLAGLMLALAAPVHAQTQTQQAATGAVPDASGSAVERYREHIGRTSADDGTQAAAVGAAPGSGGSAASSSVFPLGADRARERGVTLPRPYGLSLVTSLLDEDLTLKNLQLSVEGSDLDTLQSVQVSSSSVSTKSVQLKADVWLLPFLNVYAFGGLLDSDLSLRLEAPVADLLDELGYGDTCSPTTGSAPAICDSTVSRKAGQSPQGTSYGVGALFAGGHADWFGLLAISNIWTSVDTTDTTLEAFIASPRIGHRWHLQDQGDLAVYAGALYLRSKVTVSGDETITIPSGLSVAGTLDVHYRVREKNEQPWSAVVGANWDLTREWSLQGEGSLNSAHQGLMFSLTRRF